MMLLTMTLRIRAPLLLDVHQGRPTGDRP
jgi:hypothetical protein